MPRIAPLSCRDAGIASDARNSRIQPLPRKTMRNGVLGDIDRTSFRHGGDRYKPGQGGTAGVRSSQ
jgi:hypothetical protein